MREEWTYKKLGEVATFINGDRGKNYPSQKDFVDKGVPFINAGHIVDGKINFDSMNYITEDKYNSLNSGKIIDGDILFCLRGSLGKKAIVNGVVQGTIASSLVIIRCNDLYNQYLFHYLDSSFISSCIYKSNNGSSQPNLSATSVSKYVIPVPSLSEQQSIVAELDKINELINLKKAQLSDLDSLAQSIFYDMFGDPIENEKGWEVKKLGEVCSIERGGSPRPISDYITDSPNGINWIKIGDAEEGAIYITSTKERIKPEGMKKSRFVHKGDFILSNSMSYGKPYILGIDGCIHDGWLVIHDNNDVFDKLFLYHMLSHPSMFAQFQNMAVGGVVNNLNSKLVSNVKVFVPSKDYQNNFSKKVDIILAERKYILSTIKDLETLLASRMQYWFD